MALSRKVLSSIFSDVAMAAWDAVDLALSPLCVARVKFAEEEDEFVEDAHWETRRNRRLDQGF